MSPKTKILFEIDANTSLAVLCKTNSRPARETYSKPTKDDPVARKTSSNVLIEIRRIGTLAQVTLTPENDQVTPEYYARAYKTVLDDFRMLELELI